MKKDRQWILTLLLSLVALVTGCSDDLDNRGGEKQDFKTYKVAVVLPATDQARWSRTAAWAQQIMDEAQNTCKQRIRINLEWHDENAADVDDYLQRVATSEDYAAIIGPISAEKATVAAKACRERKKLLILPKTGNAEFQRVFASKDYVFNLTQNDIMQAEVMFSLMKDERVPGYKDYCGLITSNDQYGDTFRQWFGYLATEKYYETAFVSLIDKDHSVKDALEDYYTQNVTKNISRVFFAPSDASDFITADKEITRLSELAEADKADPKYTLSPTLFCADACVSDDVAKQVTHDYEGVDLCASPESGFNAAYQAKFGEQPIGGEAQLLDAIYLTYYSLTAMVTDGHSIIEDEKDEDGQVQRWSPLWRYFVKVVDEDSSVEIGWMPWNAQVAFVLLQSGVYPSLTGASSDLTFDPKYHCAVTTSTYRHWRLHNGKFVTLEYLTADGSDRTVSSIENWTTQVGVIQDVLSQDVSITYPEHHDNYAIIVAASKGWGNYRHQADALAMYQLLKRQGYDDDHIILIMEDDIAHNKYNPHPGEMRVTPTGENLYHDVKIDYKMSDLYPADLNYIFRGKQTKRLPKVLPSTANDNVLVFWSGHGDEGLFNYGDEYFYAEKVRDMLRQMQEEGKFRKLLFVVEACYSGSVAEVCQGIKGTLFITAANNAETSKADMYDKDLQVYLSNGFTRAFQTKITERPDVSLRDLFYYVATQTVGSHARMYNQENFGNVYTSSMSEFLNASR